MLRDGTLLSLNPRTYPNSYLHRSHPSDVARTEQLTFISTREQDDAGPTNNWMSPADAKSRGRRLSARGDAGPDDVRDPVSHGPGAARR